MSSYTNSTTSPVRPRAGTMSTVSPARAGVDTMSTTTRVTTTSSSSYSHTRTQTVDIWRAIEASYHRVRDMNAEDILRERAETLNPTPTPNENGRAIRAFDIVHNGNELDIQKLQIASDALKTPEEHRAWYDAKCAAKGGDPEHPEWLVKGDPFTYAPLPAPTKSKKERVAEKVKEMKAGVKAVFK